MKNGMYYLSSDCHGDGGTFRITEFEQNVVEGGNEIWYDLALRHNLSTGQLKKTSIPDEYHASDTANVASTVPHKVALSNSGVQTVDKLLSDSPAQTDSVYGLQPLPSTTSHSFEYKLGRRSKQVPIRDVGAFQAPVRYTPTLGSFATESELATSPC